MQVGIGRRRVVELDLAQLRVVDQDLAVLARERAHVSMGSGLSPLASVFDGTDLGAVANPSHCANVLAMPGTPGTGAWL